MRPRKINMYTTNTCMLEYIEYEVYNTSREPLAPKEMKYVFRFER